MSDQKLTTFEEVKAALDEEIAEASDTVAFYEIAASKAKHELAGYERKLWALKTLRRRMEPEVILCSVSCEAMEAAE